MPPPRMITVPGRRLQRLVDVLVRLVGVDDLAGVAVVLAVALQVGQQLQAGIADRDVDVRAAVGHPLGRVAPGGGVRMVK